MIGFVFHKFQGADSYYLYLANICMFKVSNRNTTKKCEIYSKLTIKTPNLTLKIFHTFS